MFTNQPLNITKTLLKKRSTDGLITQFWQLISKILKIRIMYTSQTDIVNIRK